MSNVFGASAIKTGVTASTDTPLVGAVDVAEVAANLEGYITPNAGYITVGNKKIFGVPTAQGFFYSSDLGEEATKELNSLVERGYAYAYQATAE